MPLSPCKSSGGFDRDELWINPAILGEEWHTLAFRDRAFRFIKIGPPIGGPGMVGLVSVSWLNRYSSPDQRANLEQINGWIQEHIKDSPGRPSLCAEVSYPGDSSFTDGLLRAVAGTKN